MNICKEIIQINDRLHLIRIILHDQNFDEVGSKDYVWSDGKIGKLRGLSILLGFETRDEPALERMHFFNGRWDQMNWYVELIAKDLSRLSEGEWTILQEEVVALHRTLSNYAKAPSKNDLTIFQDEICRYFPA